jgi:Flp pilus assembly pilin Flp
MQATQVSDQTIWKQAFKNAVLELNPTRFQPKLEAAQKAIEDRLLEVRSGRGTDRRELMELEDAKRTILFLGRHEQQTWNTSVNRVALAGAVKTTTPRQRLRKRIRVKETTFLFWKEFPMIGLPLKLWTDDTGQDIVEYAAMLAVILVLVVGTIRLVGSNANNAFSSVASSIQ